MVGNGFNRFHNKNELLVSWIKDTPKEDIVLFLKALNSPRQPQMSYTILLLYWNIFDFFFRSENNKDITLIHTLITQILVSYKNVNPSIPFIMALSIHSSFFDRCLSSTRYVCICIYVRVFMSWKNFNKHFFSSSYFFTLFKNLSLFDVLYELKSKSDTK